MAISIGAFQLRIGILSIDGTGDGSDSPDTELEPEAPPSTVANGPISTVATDSIGRSDQEESPARTEDDSASQSYDWETFDPLASARLSFAWDDGQAPPFPETVPGFRVIEDTLGDSAISVPSGGQVRIYGTETASILGWGYPMNGCGSRYWMVRWRSVWGEAVVAVPISEYAYDTDGRTVAVSDLGSDLKTISDGIPVGPAAGKSGIVGGFGCSEPAFASAMEDSNVLVDVIYQVRLCEATP